MFQSYIILEEKFHFFPCHPFKLLTKNFEKNLFGTDLMNSYSFIVIFDGMYNHLRVALITAEGDSFDIL